MVDNWMAPLCGQGSVAIYNFGTKIVGVLVSLLATVLIYFLHQKLNKLIVDKKRLVFKKQYTRILISIVLFGIVTSLILSLLSPLLVDFLYNRGKLNPEKLSLINQVQIYFSFQAPFFISAAIASKCLTSMDCNQIILRISILTTLLNAILNFIFIQYLGLAGVALSTAIAYFFSFLTMNFVLFRKIFV